MLRFGIDRFELRVNLLLLQGWIVLPRVPQSLLQIQGKSRDGNFWYVDVPVQLDRPDVRAFFGDIEELDTGFFYYGRLPQGELQALVLIQPDTAPLIVHPLTTTSQNATQKSKSLFLTLASQAWGLAREGNWRLLREKALRRYAASRAPNASMDEVMHHRIRALNIDILVIDHDMGGGANFYRQQMIDEAARRGQVLGLIVYSILRLGYVFSIKSSENNRPIGVFEGHELAELLQSITARTVFYNNAVSHPDALTWTQIIATYKLRIPSCKLVIAIHDFFPVCPSQHLLGANGKFCGVPSELSRCRECLTSTRQPLVDLYKHHGIDVWRSSWGALLQSADEILVFSPSSVNLIRRAYPQLDDSKIVLRPHQLRPLSIAHIQKLQEWHSQRTASGVIAVVGFITSEAKGAGVVQRLAKHLHDKGYPWRIKVIGCSSPAVRGLGNTYSETGPYKTEDLTDLVIQANPDIFLFPSIVPETFSFVLHEIALFGRPIAAFDIGAQSDFLCQYSNSVRLEPEVHSQPEKLTQALKSHLNI